MGAVVPDGEIREALKNLPGWTLEQKMIARHVEFRDFAEAMVFVNKVAEEAEEANHHPDIYIHYNKVSLLLTSHDSGGITQRDLKMAGTINGIFGK